MKFLAASAMALCAVTAIAAGMTGVAGAGPKIDPAPIALVGAPHAIESNVRGVPVDALPRNGECRIWYDALPAEKQPASMECEHAQWLAKKWGGRVISHDSQLADYTGRNDFDGVPTTALPRSGYCRAWLNDVDAAQQPAESDCVEARRTVEHTPGRVLFMPL